MVLADHPDAFALSQGGMSFHGGLVGLLAALLSVKGIGSFYPYYL